ncbi:helix-turn-helix domain-containing protein [Brevundimonas nasdae]|uniref:Helix-turn-helix transcriptional regulator n=1 Tax=Brevundimonas nasdae TaxID=172043 RepID=A0ABX8TJQ5_9CAUL|nr:helix-turn-helix transcriptional regulator [Brevundimonas nasdae]QYC11452.1 helix-turn-helix transcriptional regulator [Brevundimonas nasdae]QYC14240.1 helix-turn-helix transcriptional regulator [Brevundimonas nasdae]
MSQSPQTPPQPRSRTPILQALSERQRACLDLAAQGLNSAAIGTRLGLSARTVDEHLSNACDRLGVRTRIQAVALGALAERRAVEPRGFVRRPAGRGRDGIGRA